MGENLIRLTLSQTTTRSLGIGRNRLPQGQGVSRSIWQAAPLTFRFVHVSIIYDVSGLVTVCVATCFLAARPLRIGTVARAS